MVVKTVRPELAVGTLLRSIRSGGFTLVEVQVSLVILLMMAVLLYGGLQTASGAQKALERVAPGIANSRALDEFLRAQLAAVQPVIVRTGDQLKGLFVGKHDELRFAGKLPIHSGAYGIYLLRFYFDVDDAATVSGEGHRLLLEYCPLLQVQEGPDPVCDGVVKQLVVASRLGRAAFWFAEDKSGAVSRWKRRWDEESLPALVKLEFLQPRRQQDPEAFVFRVKTRIDSRQNHLVRRGDEY